MATKKKKPTPDSTTVAVESPHPSRRAVLTPEGTAAGDGGEESSE